MRNFMVTIMYVNKKVCKQKKGEASIWKDARLPLRIHQVIV